MTSLEDVLATRGLVGYHERLEIAVSKTTDACAAIERLTTDLMTGSDDSDDWNDVIHRLKEASAVSYLLSYSLRICSCDAAKIRGALRLAEEGESK